MFYSNKLINSLVLLVGTSLCYGNDLEPFSSPLASALKEGATVEQVMKIENTQLRSAAAQMLEGKYSTDYRVAQFEPVLDPKELGRQLVIGSGYSQYQGVTGIVLPKGESTVIVEGLPAGRVIGLLVPELDRQPPNFKEPTKDPRGWGLHKQSVTLNNGVNKVNLDKGGLVYVHYYSDMPKNEPAVKLHFVNGTAQGYFDITKNDDEDFARMLKEAKFPYFDAVGRHSQMIYPVEAYNRHTGTRGSDLVNRYDALVEAQHEIMGLKKYNRVPDNKILARVNYNYYMFRDGDGVAYMGGPVAYALGMVANPDSVIKGDPCWGFSHEVGHVHQLRPYFNWGGLGEVSVNIFAMHGTMSQGNASLLKERNTYAKARKAIIDANISYLEHDDVFERLAHFWQLQLYFSKNGHKDFYPDLFEKLRQQAAANTEDGWGARKGNPAVYQLNFARRVCEVGQVDLTDFFEKWGYFKLGKFDVDDYGTYHYTMTQQMVDECKAAIKAMNLPKPTEDVTLIEG